MILKKRLLISNATIFILPVIVTVAAAIIFIFVSSNIFNAGFGFGNIKSLAEKRYELFKSDSSLLQQKADMLADKDFQEYIGARLSGIKSDIVALKGNKIVFSTKSYSKIDIEKCLSEVKTGLFSDTVNLSGNNHIVKVVPLFFKDGTQGNAILLADSSQEGIAFESFLLFVITVLIASFLLTNVALSITMSKSISSPLHRLKTAAGEISRGNLAYELVEEGDDEIKELCRSFEQMRLKLKESVYTQVKYDENRKMLISSISHDLRTPITSIKGYVTGIMDGVANTPEKVDKYLKTVYSKASQVDAMIDDLLLYSRLDLSQIPFNFEKTNVLKYFRDCILECGPELEKENIELRFENEIKGDPSILVDREKFRRVIGNIIDNSRKYMNKPNGQITIFLRDTKRNIIIEMRDNGAGIRKEHLLHIFDRFYRADPSRGKIEGSGLGLAIARQIVEGHEGKIWATSRENEGTSIMISLKKVVHRDGSCATP